MLRKKQLRKKQLSGLKTPNIRLDKSIWSAGSPHELHAKAQGIRSALVGQLGEKTGIYRMLEEKRVPQVEIDQLMRIQKIPVIGLTPQALSRGIRHSKFRDNYVSFYVNALSTVRWKDPYMRKMLFGNAWEDLQRAVSFSGRLPQDERKLLHLEGQAFLLESLRKQVISRRTANAKAAELKRLFTPQ